MFIHKCDATKFPSQPLVELRDVFQAVGFVARAIAIQIQQGVVLAHATLDTKSDQNCFSKQYFYQQLNYQTTCTFVQHFFLKKKEVK